MSNSLNYDHYSNNGMLAKLVSLIEKRFQELETRLRELDGLDADVALAPGAESAPVSLADSVGRELEAYLNNPNKRVVGDWLIAGTLSTGDDPEDNTESSLALASEVWGSFTAEGLTTKFFDLADNPSFLMWVDTGAGIANAFWDTGNYTGDEGAFIWLRSENDAGTVAGSITLDPGVGGKIDFARDVDFGGIEILGGSLKFDGASFAFHFDNGEAAINCIENAGVQLKYNDSTKLDVTNTGVTVTGDILTGADDQILEPGSVRTETFASPWANFGGAYTTQGYWANKNGEIVLKGLVKSTSSVAAGATIFTLDAGYRPSTRHLQMAMTDIGPVRVDIHTTGVVQYQGTTRTVGHLSLDGLRFRLGT